MTTTDGLAHLAAVAVAFIAVGLTIGGHNTFALIAWIATVLTAYHVYTNHPAHHNDERRTDDEHSRT